MGRALAAARGRAARGGGARMSVLPEPGLISFARGIPSPDFLPVDALADCAARAIRRDGRVALNYGPPVGYGPLREWLAERHGVAVERVVVTPGSLLGLNLAIEHLADGGDAIVEAPTYDRVLHSLCARGAGIDTVARGPGGLDLDRVDVLARSPSRPSFLYVLPTFHNPTGNTLTLDQRVALVELAIERELLLFEDDPYGLLRVEGEPLPSLHSLLRERGADHLALFSSSFSKTVAPGMRIGYLLLPEHLVGPFAALATRTYVSPPLLPQAELFEFLHAGLFEAHLDTVRSALRIRRDTLLESLAAELPPQARWTRPEGGYFLWLDFPDQLDARELLEQARTAGVAFVPGSGFYADAGGEASARLSFSYPSPNEIREGARRLGTVVRTTPVAAQ
jgi:2-aminoadipate transaminase